jgi:hypothetical protein
VGRIAALLVVIALGVGAYLLCVRPSPEPERAESRALILARAADEELAEDRPTLETGPLPRPAPAEAPPQEDVKAEPPRGRTIVWPVKAGSAPVPADGTEVRLTVWTNSGVRNVPAVGRMEGGRLSVTGWGPGHAAAYAHAPDGSIARLQAQAGEDVGGETAFYAMRSIEVRVTLEGEGPAVGWAVTVHDQGGQAVLPAVRTDAAGGARITDLYGGPNSLVDVRANGFAVGSVDLMEQDGRLDVTIPRDREIVLAVRIDGTPGLPPPSTLIRIQNDFVREAGRDEAAAELRVRWRFPAGMTTAHVSLLAAGFASGSATLEWTPTGQPIRATVELQRAGTLLVRVDLPEDEHHHVHVQTFDEAQNAWPEEPRPNPLRTLDMGQPTKADADGILRLTGLRPGRYRAYDALSGIVSPEVRVAAGDAPAEVRLDLRTAGYVHGRVEIPLLQSFTGAEVELADELRTPANQRSAAGVATVRERDGTFSFRVPGNRDVRLRVTHPTLRADPRAGTAEVREPRAGVVLKLVHGPTAMVRFDREVIGPNYRRQKGPLAVRLYDGEAVGEPRARLTAMLDADGMSASFGGFEPGTWTVWVDTPPYVPAVLRGVSLADGPNDLGTASLSEGSSFVLEVKVKEGQSPPRYSLQLCSEESVPYVRNALPHARRVTGLARGRYRLVVHSSGGARTLPSEIIEFDGASEVRRTLDLR